MKAERQRETEKQRKTERQRETEKQTLDVLDMCPLVKASILGCNVAENTDGCPALVREPLQAASAPNPRFGSLLSALTSNTTYWVAALAQ